MKTICLYFQIHQPFRFRRYRFFDIGNEHYYYDDYTNESIMNRVAGRCYLPANHLMLELIEKYGCKFKVAFSISGIAIDQFELYAPEVLDSFRQLAHTGCVEFFAETYSHSLASVNNKSEFIEQVKLHAKRVEELLGSKPKMFRNTELIYSDDIGATIADMGFQGMITEGAKHVLGWKSPNFVYCNAVNPRLKVLLKNYKLSDDIAFRFSDKNWSEYPLTAEKYYNWIRNINKKEEVVNLFMDYETFGEHHNASTGIFEFLRNFPRVVLEAGEFNLATPSEAISYTQPVAAVNIPHPISWADEERDLTAWLGNEMQQEAYNKLYSLCGIIKNINDPKLLKDWQYLQVSDHFYYMSTKFFSDGAVHNYFNPYESPYDAFINYMNILSDFTIRVNAAANTGKKDDEITRLSSIIAEKDTRIVRFENEIKRLRKKNGETKPKQRKSSSPATP
ncbi:MAG: glycoside hydrolase family 57 protein, partial [Bacteroidota bacterium]